MAIVWQEKKVKTYITSNGRSVGQAKNCTCKKKRFKMPTNVQILQMSDKNMKFIKIVKNVMHCFRFDDDAEPTLRRRRRRCVGAFFARARYLIVHSLFIVL